MTDPSQPLRSITEFEETVARKWCELTGINPDEIITIAIGGAPVLQWMITGRGIRELLHAKIIERIVNDSLKEHSVSFGPEHFLGAFKNSSTP